MSSQFEIEIKTLLGEKENADKLRNKLIGKGASLSSQHKQLNHYFILKDADRFKKAFDPIITADKKDKFDYILEKGSNFSVRTREADGEVLLVVKASVDEGTSENAVSRMEFEDKMKTNMTIDELDQKLIDAGLEYQAKWSREREEYRLDDVNVCIDKNAGYGYLAEFESVVEDGEIIEDEKNKLVKLMSEFNVEELMQDRLERMFKFYNENWKDYYGTDKVFNIE